MRPPAFSPLKHWRGIEGGKRGSERTARRTNTRNAITLWSLSPSFNLWRYLFINYTRHAWSGLSFSRPPMCGPGAGNAEVLWRHEETGKCPIESFMEVHCWWHEQCQHCPGGFFYCTVLRRGGTASRTAESLPSIVGDLSIWPWIHKLHCGNIFCETVFTNAEQHTSLGLFICL